MDNIWQQSYSKDIPLEIGELQHDSLISLYKATCKKFSAKIAFECLGTTLQYHELYKLSTKFALYLQQDLNLKPGDRIAIMLPNLLQYPIVMFGALQAGLTVVNVNPMERAAALQHELTDSGAKAIIILENFVAELDVVLSETKIEHVVITRVGDILKFPDNILTDFAIRFVKRAIPSYAIKNPIFLKKILERKLNDAPQVKASLHDIAYIQYTSGTTAKAKGVILTHENILANIFQAKAWLGSNLREGKEIIITALPLYHIFSLTANCWVYSSAGSTNILIPNPKDITRFVQQLGKIKFTAITGVNTLFHALINNTKFQRLDFKDLKITLGGGMAVNKKVANDWLNLTGCHLTQAYGLTETSPAVTINPLHTEFNGSIGLPISSTLVSIQDEAGNILEVGKHGEICIKGPQVSSGYWHNQEATEAALKNGWFHTGDIGYMNAKGYVFIVDRLKDLIIVSGFNVPAIEVENCILELSEISEAAVVAAYDEHQGEAVAAHIVFADKQSLPLTKIEKYCHEKLAAYKVPHKFYVHSSLPKNNLGKVLKRKLRIISDNDYRGEN